MITSFPVPSITTSCPGWMRPLASWRPTTAGTSSERARMAVWYVRLPASVAKPRTFVQSTCAASDGVSSSAIRIDASSIARSRSRGRRHVLPQIHPQASHEIRDVALSLAQIGIGDFVEDVAELVEDLLHGPLGVHELFANERLSARHEHRIVEHQQLRVEQRGEVRAAPPCNPCTDVVQLLPRSLLALRQPFELVLDPDRRDPVPQNLCALNQDDRTAAHHARRHADAG